MPIPVDIGIFQIARTQVDRAEVRKWLDFLTVSPEFDLPDPENGVVTHPALLIALAGKRCYKSFEPGLNPNVNKIRSDYADYFDNILASGHGSVCEHAVFSFAFENVSRVFTGEMNRHRAGWAISEGSMRFIRYGESIPYWVPTSIQGTDQMHWEKAARHLEWLERDEPGREAVSGAFDLDRKKELTRMAMRLAFQSQERYYRIMERLWADELAPTSAFAGKKEITSMMRRIVGMGVATGGVWTGNVRALRHVLTMRCSPAAEEEILHVFSRVAKMMRDQEPMLFGDFEQDENGYWRPKYVKV